MPRRLFGTAGIRGPYLDRVSPLLAYRVGLAVARYVGGGGTVTTGHDIRLTSPLLARMVAAGLMAGGVDTLHLGMVPTPVLAYSVPHTSSRAGVIVTASHNPPPDNGLKVFQPTGMEYTERMEEELEELILGDWESLHVDWNSVGRTVEAPHLGEEYLEDLYSRFASEPRRIPRVAVDCANGAASGYTPRLARMLGARVVSISCHEDGYFPGRTPEPRPDVLEPFLRPVGMLGAEILLAHDGDADRLAVAVPGTGFVKQDRLIALYAKLKLADRGGKIIVSIDVGRAVEDVAERYGGRVVRAKLGKTHEKLLEHPDALLAAEPWKLIDPSWGPWVDGIYQAALIVSQLAGAGATLEELFSDIPDYPSVRRSYRVKEEAKTVAVERVFEELRSRLGDKAEENTMDGLRLDFEDGSWILVRASGTEPKIRLYAEAMDRRRLEELVGEVDAIIRGSISWAESRVD